MCSFVVQNRVYIFWPQVKTALRPPPSAQAENQFSAPFPGKRAENCGHRFFTEKGRKIYQIPPSRKGAKNVGQKKNYSEKKWLKKWLLIFFD